MEGGCHAGTVRVRDAASGRQQPRPAEAGHQPCRARSRRRSRLFAGCGFPYAAPDAAAGARITGTLCWITDRAWIDTLSQLDMLEGYDPAREAASHYLRRRWPVTTAADSDQ